MSLETPLAYFKTLWKRKTKTEMTLQGSISNLRQENEILKNENIRLKNENDQLKIQRDLLIEDFNNFIRRNVLEEGEPEEKIEDVLKMNDLLDKWKYIKLVIEDVKWDITQTINQLEQINKDSIEIREDIKRQADQTLEILLKTGNRIEGIEDFSEEFHNLFDD